MNKNNVRTFYGKSHSQYLSKYVRLSEAITAATSSAADEIDLVILPPDDGQSSSEEQIEQNNNILPADVAGQIEVHKYNNVSDEDDQDAFGTDELQPLKKKSKSKSVRDKPRWKKSEDTLLCSNQGEEPVRLVEDFPHLPDLKPFDFFGLYFTADMVSKITTETMRYAQLKNNHSFHVSNNDVYQFLGLILISGYHTLPGEKDCWSTNSSLSAPIFSRVISRNRFQQIKQYFHLADNENLTESKTAKVDPICDELLKNCQQFGICDKLLSIDESMVPYRGHFSIKQYIRSKPIRLGYKFWFLCGADGYPYNFELCKGKDDGRKEPLGTSVVKRMSSIIESDKCKNHILHFDNFFTSYSLLVDLTGKNLRAMGTVQSNRTESCFFGVTKKDERASYDYKSDGAALFVQWKDNSIVTVGTNFSKVTPVDKVSRWVKGKGKVSVDQPKVISEYSKGTGGVDLLDMLLRSYCPNLCTKKWWWALFSNALNIAVVAAFKVHKKECVDQLSHLDFRIEVPEVMVRANHEAQRVRLGGPTASGPGQIRLDGVNHTLVPTSPGRCIYYQSNTRLKCSKCDKRLHKKVYHEMYHSK